jgi:hypothetical protein
MLPDFSADATGAPVAHTPTNVAGSPVPERIESLIDTASPCSHSESRTETESRYEDAKKSRVTDEVEVYAH